MPIFFWAISQKRPLFFCLWVVFWQARMPKTRLAAASIPEWPKTASKSLLWFPRPAQRQWELLNIFGEKKTYENNKKNFFVFFDRLYVCVELRVILEFTDLTFSNNSALSFVRIYRAHPVH
jgi:hypothetical protein